MIEISGEVLADRVREFIITAAPQAGHGWDELLDVEWTATFSGNVAKKEHWVDLYRRRKEDSAAIDPVISRALAGVVHDLSEFNGDRIILVLVNAPQCTYFIWLSPDLSRVITCFHAKDGRQA